MREFLEIAFGHAGLDYKDFVRTDKRLYRPAEVNLLLGDTSQAKDRLGWQYARTFRELVSEMVNADLAHHRGAPARD